jgi:3-oxoacyl-[acyl-carrier-protein] synthase-1
MNMPASQGKVVYVVGVGGRTAIGLTAPASAAAVRAGIAGFTDHPSMIDQHGNPFVVARAPYLSADVVGAERFSELALPAAREALEPISGLIQETLPMPLIVGVPAPRPGLPAELEAKLLGQLTDVTSHRCRISEILLLPTGHSAGLMAIEAGCQKIASGSTEFCLAGGVDSYLDAATLEWVAHCDQLHTISNAWGFVPGEAAGFSLLCSSAAAKRCELPVLGQLVAITTGHEENRIKTATICTGQGLSQVVRQVLQSLPPNTLIDYTICDQNGEPYRADECGFMLARTSASFVDASDFLAPADCWGDVGAASGPLFVMLAVAAARKRYAKGPYTLLWTSSEGGERAATIIHAEVPIGRAA